MEIGFQPKMIGIICNWCCYGGADLAGVSRFQYPPYIRLVRVMCSARVDPLHIFRAYSKGADAIFVGGCHLCDCHYVTQGNFNAYSMVQVCKTVMKYMGIAPERLRLEWVSAGEGTRFANFMNEYSAQITELGPLGKGEGLTKEQLELKIKAITKLIPYIKLVLTQRLHVAERTEEAYYEFFSSDEFKKLFDETIKDKLAISQITTLLKTKPMNTAQLAENTGLGSSEISRHIDLSTRHGLVRYDTKKSCFTLA